MNNIWLIILLISISAFLLVCVIVLLIKQRSVVKRTKKRDENRYKQILRKYQDELTRIEFLYDELKNKDAENSSSNLKISQEQEVNALMNAETIIIEQKKLEEQKNEFAAKNRKLWEMSISLQKEKDHIAVLKHKIELEFRNVTDSIKYAKLIQNAVLPEQIILDNFFDDHFLFWRPREIVSGDFYWMKNFGDNLYFTVADCTGHGVPGAFMSMLGVAFLNEICSSINSEITPAEILEQMRTKVMATLKQNELSDQKDGMDMAMCLFNKSKMTVTFSGANNGMYLVRNDELTDYKPVKNPIGIYPRIKPFENTQIEVCKGDYIYMFSDGFADQFSATQMRKVTSGKMKKLLVEINGKTNVANQQASLLGEFIDNWRGDYVQMDDILVGGYKI